ncbi:hypothetical protein ACGC1H_006750 [Rhizoctonia solani]|uniref:BTB domain-containing protein n=1 Tax=Rhizoctonia solani TaxID=456999 RepID=A0A8H2XTW3_9AGAM|nr:unnamed protein product [Rhizoctonia solani]
MPKRSSSASVASQRSVTTRSQKRAKLDETEANSIPTPAEETKEPEENHEENREENHESNHEEDTEENGNTVSIIRDPKYYFEDGNVTLRVHQVLFKVHSSLFKAHSEDFLTKLNPSFQVDGSTVAGGTSDEDAIIIPDTQPSQLRNLMKVVYCLPSNNVVFGNNKALVGNFECYLDVALLSRRFDMQAMQQWAKKKLADLAHVSGKLLADQFDDFYCDVEDSNYDIYSDNETFSSVDEVDPPASYNGFALVKAVQYARAVSHRSLLQDMLSILEYYYAYPKTNIMFLVSFFRIEDLRTTDPSLFGFFFLVLLDRGNQVWIDKIFTQEERMALFSAQSFLTPLPESLKASALAPLFTEPTSAQEFAAILSENSKCEAGCHNDIFSHWLKAFPTSYYEGVKSREFSVSIKALTALPLYRLNFATGVGRVKCLTCRRKILRKLDQDMQEVFVRLAEYYKVYD